MPACGDESPLFQSHGFVPGTRQRKNRRASEHALASIVRVKVSHPFLEVLASLGIRPESTEYRASGWQGAPRALHQVSHPPDAAVAVLVLVRLKASVVFLPSESLPT